MSEWRPIETAPKDGSVVLLWEKGSELIYDSNSEIAAGYCRYDGHWTTGQYDFWCDEIECCKPTHWMPLPEPPQ